MIKREQQYLLAVTATIYIVLLQRLGVKKLPDAEGVMRGL